jgi:hypothetical protein
MRLSFACRCGPPLAGGRWGRAGLSSCGAPPTRGGGRRGRWWGGGAAPAAPGWGQGGRREDPGLLQGVEGTDLHTVGDTVVMKWTRPYADWLE